MTPTPIVNPTTFPVMNQYGSISSIINLITPILIIGAGVIFTIMVIVIGFMYMQSRGNPDALKKIRDLFIYAIIGMILILGAYLLVKLLGTLFEIKNLPL